MSGSDEVHPASTARVLRWERAARTRWGAYLTASEREALQLALALAEPTTALDLGCGTGRWSRLLIDAGWSVACADVDAEALEVCQRRMPSVTCIEMHSDDQGLPAATNSLGLVAAMEVAPLVEQPWFAEEVTRILSPGGLLVCTYYNSRSLRGLAYRTTRRPHGYYAGPSFSHFRSRLARAGFELVHTEGLAWFPFRRDSNSSLVPLCTKLEQTLGLRRLTRFSPFVVLVARWTDAAEARLNQMRERRARPG